MHKLPIQALTPSNNINIRALVNTFSRSLSRRCANNPGPRCPKLRDDNICTKVKRKSDKTPPIPRPMTSMWLEPECCKILHCDWRPRFDDMYWKESDKNKRKYQQTWAACPEFKYVPRICEYDTRDPPPMEKRKRKEIIKLNDCPLKVQCIDLTRPCPKILSEKCREARKNVRCHRNRTPKCCKKFCTPQPAYSECRRKIIKYKNKTQCKCTEIPMICEVLEGAAAEERLAKPNRECPC